MPKIRYGGEQGEAFELVKSQDMLAVRTHSRRSLLPEPVVPRERSLLEGMDRLIAFPEAAVEVFRRRDEEGAAAAAPPLEDLKRELRRQPDIRFAGSALEDPESGEPVLYTENLFVKFTDDAEPSDCLAILRDAGLVAKRELDYARNAYFVEAPEGIGVEVFDLALEIQKKEAVELAHPELIRRVRQRAIFPQQWHLKLATINGQQINAHAAIEAAQAITQGEGVTVAIIDDGVDLDHQEFSSPGKIVAPRDVTRRSDNPRPANDDDHGTACAGVACADGRLGASGVAPKARLMPIRLRSGLGSQAEADAFVWAANHGADVISCSWGPRDGRWWDRTDPLHKQVVPLPDSTRLAIDFAADNGRGGKGCVICFAAGNGNESVDNDGYASYGRVIAVAACNDRGRRSVYSDFGRAVLCSFPSSDFEFPQEDRPAPLTPGVWTTDRSGFVGYNDGDARLGDAVGHYTNGFGGTSSSCPGAAGVAALVLARNPALRWDEVRDILGRSCDRIDPQGGNYNAQGRSPLYGFGRLNAATAVELALPPRPTNNVLHIGNFSTPIRDLQTAQVAVSVGETTAIAALKVVVEIDHTFIGDLVVTLLPPAALGTGGIVLHNRTGGGTRNLRRTFDAVSTPALASLQGRTPRGTWTLQVQDTARVDEGTIVRFGVELTFAPSRSAAGPEAPAPDDGARRRPRAKAMKAKATAPDGGAPPQPKKARKRPERKTPKSD